MWMQQREKSVKSAFWGCVVPTLGALMAMGVLGFVFAIVSPGELMQGAVDGFEPTESERLSLEEKFVYEYGSWVSVLRDKKTGVEFVVTDGGGIVVIPERPKKEWRMIR